MSFPILRAFLEDPARPDGTLSNHELQGFLFAVACAPELVPPSEWLPIVCNEQEPEYESLAQVEVVIAELMALYNEVNAGVFEGAPALPPDCSFARKAMANLEDGAPVSQWAQGFLVGHEWLEESWDFDLPDDVEKELGAVLMVLTFFSSRTVAQAYCDETGGGPVEEPARTVTRMFPGALASYAQIRRTLGEVANMVPVAPARARAKVGRNDLCPCGSGRKYKRCCGGGTSH